MESSLTTSQNLKVDVSYDPVILLLDRFLKDLSNFILLMLLGFCTYVHVIPQTQICFYFCVILYICICLSVICLV